MKRALIIVIGVFLLAYTGIGAWCLSTLAAKDEERLTPEEQAALTERVPVTFTVTPPADSTPQDQVIYLAGSGPLGAWDAAGIALSAAEDGQHRATVDLIKGVEYSFKVTRGTWGTVEVHGDDTDVANRAVRAGEPTRVDVAVEAWRDKGQSVPGRITLTGDMREHKAIPMPPLPTRDLIVYLPPGYETDAERRYPVLYLQDGRNLFDESTAYAGIEWRVDETAQRMIEAGLIKPVIIVGVSNTEDRTAEFTPGTSSQADSPPDKQGENDFGSLAPVARGDAYADAMVEVIKPFIDEHYRTLPGPEHTAAGGAGLGAIITLHTIDRHPGVFDAAVALSPFDWGGDPSLLAPPDEAGPASVTQYWTDSAALGEMLAQRGAALKVVPAADETRNESHWRTSVQHFLLWLYPTSEGSPNADLP